MTHELNLSCRMLQYNVLFHMVGDEYTKFYPKGMHPVLNN